MKNPLKGIYNSLISGNGQTFGRKAYADNDARKLFYKDRLLRTTQDVEKWRRAISVAEDVYFPDRVYLMQLYQDTVLNGHVIACLNRRRALSLLKDMQFQREDGTVDEKASLILKKKWFRKIMRHTIDARWFGYSFLNYGDIENSEPVSVRSLQREVVNPEGRFISSILHSPSGTKWEGSELEEWVSFITTDSDTGSTDVGLGLLYPVAYYEIFLRHLTGFNADYVEVFGQPLRKGTTTKQGVARDEFETALANMGSSPYVVLDDLQDDVELVTGSSGSGKGFESYDNFEKRLESKISKILLGHADALDSVPGKLGNDGEASPASLALQDIEEEDNDFMETALNDEIIPALRTLGVVIPEGLTVRYVNDREEKRAQHEKNKNRNDVADYAKKLKDAGFTLSEEELSEEMGMTVSTAAPAPEQKHEF